MNGIEISIIELETIKMLQEKYGEDLEILNTDQMNAQYKGIVKMVAFVLSSASLMVLQVL